MNIFKCLISVVSNILLRPLVLFRFNRIGPDIFVTHWMLHFESLMALLCKSKLGSFGHGSSVRPFSYLVNTKQIYIGNNVVVRHGSTFVSDDRPSSGYISIEDNVLLGAHITIYTNNHSFDDPGIPICDQGYPDATESDSVVIRSGAWIGFNTTILKGVIIGKNCVVGASSLVNKSIPDGEVWAGVPARRIRTANKNS